MCPFFRWSSSEWIVDISIFSFSFGLVLMKLSTTKFSEFVWYSNKSSRKWAHTGNQIKNNSNESVSIKMKNRKNTRGKNAKRKNHFRTLIYIHHNLYIESMHTESPHGAYCIHTYTYKYPILDGFSILWKSNENRIEWRWKVQCTPQSFCMAIWIRRFYFVFLSNAHILSGVCARCAHLYESALDNIMRVCILSMSRECILSLRLFPQYIYNDEALFLIDISDFECLHAYCRSFACTLHTLRRSYFWAQLSTPFPSFVSFNSISTLINVFICDSILPNV